jgi:hypothetical protein
MEHTSTIDIDYLLWRWGNGMILARNMSPAASLLVVEYPVPVGRGGKGYPFYVFVSRLEKGCNPNPCYRYPQTSGLVCRKRVKPPVGRRKPTEIRRMGWDSSEIRYERPAKTRLDHKSPTESQRRHPVKHHGRSTMGTLPGRPF